MIVIASHSVAITPRAMIGAARSVDRGAIINNPRVWLCAALATIAAIVVAAGWYRTGAELRQLRIGELQPIVGLLKEDQELLQDLQRKLQSDSSGFGILASYLAKIRADGLPKHAGMKQQLDRLAENNSEILALINVYAPRAKTAALSAEADKFRRYAIAWRDRWNSVMEIFMAGGNYPVAEIPFPMDFSIVVEAEIAAAK